MFCRCVGPLGIFRIHLENTENPVVFVLHLSSPPFGEGRVCKRRGASLKPQTNICEIRFGGKSVV
jgi:hypothetical protein